MLSRTLLAACAVVAVAGSSAFAQPVAPTSLALGTSGPFASPDWNATPFSNFAWFTFTITSPTAVDIDINRTAAPHDLVASLYAGDITGVDATSFGTYGGVDQLAFSDFGPMLWVSFEDDTEDDTFGGPFGDPRFVLVLPAGTYSLAVSQYDFDGSFTITSNVPAPSAAAALGLAGLASLRRRR